MLSITIWFLVLSLAAVCGPAQAGSPSPPPDPRLAGGDTTIFDVTSAAFEAPAPNLTDDELLIHIQGDAAFDAAFVSAPAPIFPGLGPIFNNTACSACHPGNGRGEPAIAGQRPPTDYVFTPEPTRRRPRHRGALAGAWLWVPIATSSPVRRAARSEVASDLYRKHGTI